MEIWSHLSLFNHTVKSVKSLENQKNIFYDEKVVFSCCLWEYKAFIHNLGLSLYNC